MPEQEPRGAYVAVSGWWLDAVGIPADLDDNAFAEILDIVVKESVETAQIEYQNWVDDHPEDE